MLLTCRSVEAEDVVQCGSPHFWDCHNIDDSEIDLPLNELKSPEPIGLGHLVNFGTTLLGETQQSEWTNAGKKKCVFVPSSGVAALCAALLGDAGSSDLLRVRRFLEQLCCVVSLAARLRCHIMSLASVAESHKCEESLRWL